MTQVDDLQCTTVACLNCGNGRAERLPSREDRRDYRCPTCGEFSVSRTTERIFELGLASPQHACFIIINGKGWLKPVQ